MKLKGYLLSVFVVLMCFMGAYALCGFDDRREVHTPDYYEVKVRAMFKSGQWDSGKLILDEGMKHYTDVSGLNELLGRYYYQYRKDYDKARYFLVRSLRDNPENVTAKQMLVNVEDESGNYSSAICYVNELLEINPYWQGLWRKKIGLYRKQGNDVEADRLLKRLHQIYPNDSTVSNEYAYSLEENYVKQRKKGNISAAIRYLNDLLSVVTDNEDYYMALSNLLLQQGSTEKALEVIGAGVSNIPRSSELVIKKAEILIEEGRYQEAIAFVRSRMKYNKNPRLIRFNENLLAEAANAAKLNDPYLLYGQLYEQTKSKEALDYLINTSIQRGYNEDALWYLSEAKKRYGEQSSWLYKEYVVYKRMGNVNKAYSILSTLVGMNPTDIDLADELAMLRLHQAGNLMADGFYSEALPYLTAAVKSSYDKDVRSAALSKTYACYYELKRYDEAMVMLDSLHVIYPEDGTYFIKKADILNAQDSTLVALSVLDSVLADTTVVEMRVAYISSYEEMAVPYIKGLIEKGASEKAFEESVKLLHYNPSSIDGLWYAINTADMLNRYEEYDRYIAKARAIYPEETVYVVKMASSYHRMGEYQRSIDMVRPWLNDYPDNQGLIGAFSENSEMKALQLLKEHKLDSALAVADTALLFDAKNPSLLLVKGQVYEAMHKYDSAYYYQRHYVPGITESADFMRHLDGLQNKVLKNVLSAEYLRGRYGEADVITSVASLSYTYRGKKNSYTGRINYAGRDGSATGDDPEDQVPGGQGVQLYVEWEHRFSQRWTGALAAALSNKYFPKVMADARISHEFKRDITLDVHANYRRIPVYSKDFRWEEGWTFDGWNKNDRNLFTLGVGASKTWNNLLLGGKIDGFLFSANPYFNASTQLKYFLLEDGYTSVSVSAGLGTAPEANMIDYAMPGAFDRLNTMVGMGGVYMFNEHLSVGLTGTWHTFYSQLNQRQGTLKNYNELVKTEYRNLYNVHLQLYIYF